MVVCFLGIGSNLGNRSKNIKLALGKIKALKGTRIIKLSKIRETVPVGGPAGQGEFLNAVLKIKTNLSPLLLLKKLKNIEGELGRVNTVRWGPRVIDLDILFYGSRVINTKVLKIPHPRILQREFVLKPLLELICS